MLAKKKLPTLAPLKSKSSTSPTHPGTPLDPQNSTSKTTKTEGATKQDGTKTEDTAETDHTPKKKTPKRKPFGKKSSVTEAVTRPAPETVGKPAAAKLPLPVNNKAATTRSVSQDSSSSSSSSSTAPSSKAKTKPRPTKKFPRKAAPSTKTEWVKQAAPVRPGSGPKAGPEPASDSSSSDSSMQPKTRVVKRRFAPAPPPASEIDRASYASTNFSSSSSSSSLAGGLGFKHPAKKKVLPKLAKGRITSVASVGSTAENSASVGPATGDLKTGSPPVGSPAAAGSYSPFESHKRFAFGSEAASSPRPGGPKSSRLASPGFRPVGGGLKLSPRSASPRGHSPGGISLKRRSQTTQKTAAASPRAPAVPSPRQPQRNEHTQPVRQVSSSSSEALSPPMPTPTTAAHRGAPTKPAPPEPTFVTRAAATRQEPAGENENSEQKPEQAGPAAKAPADTVTREAGARDADPQGVATKSTDNQTTGGTKTTSTQTTVVKPMDQPTATPVKAATIPVETTTASVKSTTAPVKTTTTPMETTTTPAKTTTAPAKTPIIDTQAVGTQDKDKQTMGSKGTDDKPMSGSQITDTQITDSQDRGTQGTGAQKLAEPKQPVARSAVEMEPGAKESTGEHRAVKGNQLAGGTQAAGEGQVAGPDETSAGQSLVQSLGQSLGQFVRESLGPSPETSTGSVAGPAVSGPTVAGPTVAGPTVAGPTVVGPAMAGGLEQIRAKEKERQQEALSEVKVEQIRMDHSGSNGARLESMKEDLVSRFKQLLQSEVQQQFNGLLESRMRVLLSENKESFLAAERQLFEDRQLQLLAKIEQDHSGFVSEVHTRVSELEKSSEALNKETVKQILKTMGGELAQVKQDATDSAIKLFDEIAALRADSMSWIKEQLNDTMRTLRKKDVEIESLSQQLSLLKSSQSDQLYGELTAYVKSEMEKKKKSIPVQDARTMAMESLKKGMAIDSMSTVMRRLVERLGVRWDLGIRDIFAHLKLFTQKHHELEVSMAPKISASRRIASVLHYALHKTRLQAFWSLRMHSATYQQLNADLRRAAYNRQLDRKLRLLLFGQNPPYEHIQLAEARTAAARGINSRQSYLTGIPSAYPQLSRRYTSIFRTNT
ncbi:hypothetical protein GNI_141270 [Gregarina niphandrodes]|uniref:Uncharacterized protein n=1 Tax=Gregarina niphandrodes TaxID=110365 RepID=A0A023B0I3_GRENI|nr:hypothetical protein GNI_141270 [Gregarina niphandrodes]EZG45056.1 hypothetical protein GNI_141270 [Gregarina niphandrodes]|eukprot:XP_011132587.1 hypothetical protein GNI_141270 [Gregarina niphandrodes]